MFIQWLQSKNEEHLLKQRKVFAAVDCNDSEENEKPLQQNLEIIVQNASSKDQTVQLSAVQAAR